MKKSFKQPKMTEVRIELDSAFITGLMIIFRNHFKHFYLSDVEVNKLIEESNNTGQTDRVFLGKMIATKI